MNIRLDVAIRDLTGKSGRAILEAILAGQGIQIIWLPLPISA